MFIKTNVEIFLLNYYLTLMNTIKKIMEMYKVKDVKLIDFFQLHRHQSVKAMTTALTTATATWTPRHVKIPA